jgi:hypothetical protein
MGKVGDVIGTADKALSLLGKLGLWGPAVTTAITAGVLWAWSAMMSLPGPVIALCAIFGAAGGLWLYNGLNDLRRTRLESIEMPDYEAWDHVHLLTLAQAANLWAECEPSGGVKKKAYPYFRMLKEQATIGVIDTQNEFGEVDTDSLVLRKDLRDLPAAKSMRPKFLFPEKR